ncbi:hypothetical protein D3C85_1480980 [compost metagenome]
MVEVVAVDQPHQQCAGHAAQHLRRDIAGGVGPGKLAGHRQRDGDRRIEVGAADGGDAEHADKHRHRPAEGDHDQAAVMALGAFQDHVGNHAVAEQHQQGGADEFAE